MTTYYVLRSRKFLQKFTFSIVSRNRRQWTVIILSSQYIVLYILLHSRIFLWPINQLIKSKRTCSIAIEVLKTNSQCARCKIIQNDRTKLLLFFFLFVCWFLLYFLFSSFYHILMNKDVYITHLSAGLRQKATVQKATERNVNIELMEGSMC